MTRRVWLVACLAIVHGVAPPAPNFPDDKITEPDTDTELSDIRGECDDIYGSISVFNTISGTAQNACINSCEERGHQEMLTADTDMVFYRPYLSSSGDRAKDFMPNSEGGYYENMLTQEFGDAGEEEKVLGDRRLPLVTDQLRTQWTAFGNLLGYNQYGEWSQSTPEAFICREALMDRYLQTTVTSVIDAAVDESAKKRTDPLVVGDDAASGMEPLIRQEIKDREGEYEELVANIDDEDRDANLVEGKAHLITKEVSESTSRESAEVMRTLSQTEKDVEDLWSQPAPDTSAQTIALQERLAIEKYTGAEDRMVALEQLQGLNVASVEKDLRGGQRVLEAAEGAADDLAYDASALDEMFGEAVQDLITEAGENLTTSETELREFENHFSGDLTLLTDEYLEKNTLFADELRVGTEAVEAGLAEQVEEASEASAQDLEDTEKEYGEVDTNMDEMIDTLEKRVDHLDVFLDDAYDGWTALKNTVTDSSEAIQDAADEAVASVSDEAREAYEARERSFQAAYKTASSETASALSESVDGAITDLFDGAAIANGDLEMKDGFVTGEAEEVALGLDDVHKDLDRVVHERFDEMAKLGTLASQLLFKWNKVTEAAKTHQRDFKDILDAESERARRGAYVAAQGMSRSIKQVETAIMVLEDQSSSSFKSTVKNVIDAIVQSAKHSESSLLDIEVISPGTVQLLVNGVNNAMTEIQGTVVPQARATMLDAWNHAHAKADLIMRSASDELAEAVPAVEKEERSFQQSVTDLMDSINKAMFESLSSNHEEMNAGMEELNSLVADVMAHGEAAGGDIVMFLNAEDAAARKLHQDLVAQGLNVESATAKELDMQRAHVSEQESKIGGFIQAMKTNHDAAVAAIQDAEGEITKYTQEEASGLPGSEAITAVKNAGAHDFAHVEAAAALMGENVDALANYTGNAEGAVVADTYAAILALEHSMHESGDMEQNSTAMLTQLRALFEANRGAVQLSVEQFAEQFATHADDVFSATTAEALKTIAAAGSGISVTLDEAEKVIGGAANDTNYAITEEMKKIQAEQANATGVVQEYSGLTSEGSSATSEMLHDLETAETEMEDDAAADANMFEKEIDAIKGDLKDALWATRKQVHSLIWEMKQGHTTAVDMTAFDDEMNMRMQEMQENMTDVKSELNEAVAAAWKSKVEHKARYQSFEQEARAFLNMAQVLQDLAAKDEKDGMQTFTSALLHARNLVGEAAKTVERESAEIFGNTSNSITVLSALDSRAAAQVKVAVEKIETGLGHFDQELARLLELEQYQEDHVLHGISADIDAVNTSVVKLRAWREQAESDSLTWKTKVQNEFESMGEALDLTELQAEEEKAAQQFAVQQAMEHLTTHLSDELGSMSASAQSQIAKLTAVAGAEIKALMEDTALSDAEKAKRLAEIKERLRQDALQVLRSGVSGDVHNAALERRLRAGEEEVLNTVAQISSLRETTDVSQKSLDDQLNNLKQRVADAGANIGDDLYGSSFLEREPASYEKAAAEDAAWEKLFSS